MMAPPASRQEPTSSTSNVMFDDDPNKDKVKSLTMPEEFFMNEQDAEILERGLADSDETIEDATSQNKIVERGIPSDSLEGTCDNSFSNLRVKEQHASTGDPEHSMDVSNQNNLAALDRSSLIEHLQSDPVKSNSSLTEYPPIESPRLDASHHSYRRCLSGDIRPILEHRESNDGHGITVSPSSVLQETEESSPKKVPHIRSSRSIDRMLSEAAQFAEAVGELPPRSESDVQEIIETAESDSDDESTPEVEIHVDETSFHEAEKDTGDGLREFIEEGIQPGTSRSRCASDERRLSEAAQFAEAVGELPPSSSEEVPDIIEGEESEDSESEESDKEIYVEDIIPEEEELTVSVSKHSKVDDPSHSGYDSQLDSSHHRRKCRPRWPFKESPETTRGFLHKLPDGVNTQDFEYKGICSNPPEITKRGIQRGNYAQLHRKAWLEVSDKYHRYGKNLRLYYRYWERLGFPSNSFFDWLDSKGEAAGQPLPSLPECPRSTLDCDTVLYITNPDVTEGYILDVLPDEKGRGLLVDVDGDPVKTGPDGWIFVVRDNSLYGAQKIASISGHSKQRFHHSSFFCGKAVAAAGIIITDDDGYVTRQYPHSGHYRPGAADVQRMLFYLHHKGVDLRTFEMDTQQIFHVARGESTKKKKVDSLHLMPAVHVACFLAHKARCIEKGLFAQIHKIRKADVASVSEFLDLVDEGGFWKKLRIDLKRRASEK